MAETARQRLERLRAEQADEDVESTAGVEEVEPGILDKIIAAFSNKGEHVSQLDMTSGDNPKFDSDLPGTVERDLGGNRVAALEMGLNAAGGLLGKGMQSGRAAAALAKQKAVEGFATKVGTEWTAAQVPIIGQEAAALKLPEIIELARAGAPEMMKHGQRMHPLLAAGGGAAATEAARRLLNALFGGRD